MDNSKLISVVALLLFQCISRFNCSVSAVESSTPNNSSVYTPAELAGVEKLRRSLAGELYQEYMKENAYLIRWIWDSDLDLDKAKEKLHKALIWRKKNRIDSILQEDFRFILQTCPFDVTGRDKEGRPILIASLGQCSLRKLALMDQKKLQRATIWLMEYLSKVSREGEYPGGPPQQGVIIAEMSGTSLREHICFACLPFFTTLIDLYVNYYPENASHIYMINMSRIAVSLVNILIPLAPPNYYNKYKDKLYTFGFDKKEWQTEILRTVDADQLSPPFGGTRAPKYFMQ